MNSKALHIRINRMIIEGLPISGRQRFVHAIESQLSRFAQDLPSNSWSAAGKQDIATLDAGHLRGQATSEQAASQVTEALRSQLETREVNRRA